MPKVFDIQTILLAKHAQHVVLVHFPIALFITGVGLDLLSRGKTDSALRGAAYLNISIAAAMVIPTVLTGVLAWQFALEGKKLKGLLLLHLLTASCAALAVLLSWVLHWRSRKAESAVASRYPILVEVIGVLLIAVTAHLGGFLSGVNS